MATETAIDLPYELIFIEGFDSSITEDVDLLSSELLSSELQTSLTPPAYFGFTSAFPEFWEMEGINDKEDKDGWRTILTL